MIFGDTGVTNEQSGVSEEYSYNTKQENLSVLYHIVRSQLYSDEVYAVIREIIVNAMDIHTAIGKPNLPVKVTLPTLLEPYFKVRDFGTGLTKEQIYDYYVSYGASSKRNDNQQTGCLGVGAAAPLCLSDSFLVNSYQKGVLTCWNCYIDETQSGKVAKMSEEQVDESDGLEVVVPVKLTDIDKFHEKTVWFARYSKVCPEFINLSDKCQLELNEFLAKKPIFQGEDWCYYINEPSYIVMGSIRYPLDVSVFSDIEIPPKIKSVLERGLVIWFETRDLDFAASREKLKYTQRTKDTIIERISDIIEFLSEKVSKDFESCSSIWEAKLFYSECFKSDGNLYYLKSLLDVPKKFNGNNIVSTNIDINHKITVQKYGLVYDEIKSFYIPCLVAQKDSVLINNDLNFRRGIKNRIAKYLFDKKNVYLVSFESDEIRKKFYEDTGMQKHFINLSSIPRESLNKYIPSDNVANPKSLRREFLFHHFNSSSYSRTRTNDEYWDETDIDAANHDGLYVLINRYRVYWGDKWIHSSEFASIVKEMMDNKIINEPIYGIKSTVQLTGFDEIKNNKEMVSLFFFFKESISKLVENNDIDDFNCSGSYIPCVLGDYNAHLFLNKIAPENHPLRVLAEKISKIIKLKHDKKLDFIKRWGIEFKFIANNSNNDCLNESERLKDIYPLLDLHKYSHLSEPQIQHLKLYIKAVDAENSQHLS